MGKLDSKVAIVTGASKGIGAGIVERLAADGAKVVVNYSRSAPAADVVVKRIEAAGGIAFAVQADVSQPAEIEKLVAAATTKFGPIDILVNNAGIYAADGLEAVTPESIDKHYALNVRGLLLTTKAAVAQFPKSGGVVVNISSGAAKTPIANMHVYSSTKGAVDILTRTPGARAWAARHSRRRHRARRDDERGRHRPSACRRRRWTRWSRARRSAGSARPRTSPMRVAFVVSDEGRWITGETISGRRRPAAVARGATW